MVVDIATADKITYLVSAVTWLQNDQIRITNNHSTGYCMLLDIICKNALYCTFPRNV